MKSKDIKNQETIEYVIYCRKSTDESSNKQVASIPRQIKECMKYAKRKKLKLKKRPKDFSAFESEKEIKKEDNCSNLDDRKIYLNTRNIFIVKEQKSGKTPFKRKKWTKICKLIKKGKIKGLLSYSPDRQSRNMLEGGELINFVDEDILTLKYASFHFEPNAAGKMMLGIWFVFSKQYADKLGEDVSAGNKHAISKSETVGAVKPGYIRREKDSKWETDGDNFEIVKEAFKLKLEENLSDEKIAKYMNNRGYHRIIKKTGNKTIMTHQKVGKMFKDTFYYGLFIHGNHQKDLRENSEDFQAVITEDQFNVLAERREDSGRGKRQKNDVDELETIRVVENGFVINSKGFGFSLSLPSKNQRFIPKLEELKKTKKDAILGDVVKPTQIKLQNNKIKKIITFEVINEIIRKKISKLKITKKHYQGYLSYAKKELNEVLKEKTTSRRQCEIRIAKIRSEKEEYIKKCMGIDKDKEELAIYNKTKDSFKEKIEFNKELIRKIDFESDIEISNIETMLKFMRNAVSYYDKATYVQKARIIKILFLNIIYYHDKRLVLKVNPGLEELFSLDGRPGES